MPSRPRSSVVAGDENVRHQFGVDPVQLDVRAVMEAARTQGSSTDRHVGVRHVDVLAHDPDLDPPPSRSLMSETCTSGIPSPRSQLAPSSSLQ